MSLPGSPPVIAVDGGNSKTDVLLVAEDGRVLGRSRGPGASPQNIGLDASVALLERLVLDALADGGLPARRPFGRHSSVYLAGMDLPAEEEAFSLALTAREWSASATVANDTFALLRAGTEDGAGVAVVCGAGINCVGVSADGRVHRFPALGKISGDWGGGLQLGEEALWSAVRAEDGRGPGTGLRDAVCEHFGVNAVVEVMERLHFGEYPYARLHELSPVLFRVAATGDEVAQGVVDRLIEEVVVLATVTLRRLALTDGAPAVILGGGVLTGVGETVTGEIERRCRKVAPNAVVRVVDVAPVVGAALSGLDAVGADAAAKQRLRASSVAAPEGGRNG
ncbi:N-acetylglucosamine kinase [Amycolatopsis suaedae]|uniref:ATPase n=1 Tax=Amycolatopsis suaedae TaxID=2510978 RepID=A0A4Q7J984_9PSEU|nr:BadF/BadG/BcrA/BcrD ATPase family protein [Amycolatopsis suaedae]RZQ63779.1 ATPase [Amycolatopsis suaedae]